MMEQTILGQKVCNVSVLSVAIAPDVSFADSRNLQEVSSQIEVYLDVIANAVSEGGGTILTANVCAAKGYEILALFGAPISLDNHPRQAVHTALNIIWRFQGDKDCAFLSYLAIDSGKLLIGDISGQVAVSNTLPLACLCIVRFVCGVVLLPDAWLITRPVLEVSKDLVGAIHPRRVRATWSQKGSISAFEVQER